MLVKNVAQDFAANPEKMHSYELKIYEYGPEMMKTNFYLGYIHKIER